MKKIKIKTTKREIILVFFFLAMSYTYLVGLREISCLAKDVLGLKRTPVMAQVVTSTPAELSNYEWMHKEWTDAGAKWEEVWAIVQAESRWNQEAVNVNTNGSIDRGLYQLNSIHKINPSCSFDLRCSTHEAIKLWKAQGWTPWVASRKLGL